MYCYYCGKENNDTDKFCKYCGKGLHPPKHASLIVPILIIPVLLFVGVGLYLYFSGELDDLLDASNEKQAEIILDEEKEDPLDGSGDGTAESTEIETHLEESPDETKSSEKPELSAEEAKTALTDIDDALSSYIWALLMTNDLYNVGDILTPELSDPEKVRAAALASDTDGKFDDSFVYKNGKLEIDNSITPGPNEDGYHGLSVSDKIVDKNCRDLFGTPADINILQTKILCDSYDAVKYTDDSGSYAILVSDETETEMDKESHECRVKENGNGFTGEVDLFFGYWGELEYNPGYSNYTIKYFLEPDAGSKYKLTVSGIEIIRISDAPASKDEGRTGDSDEYTAYPADSKQHEPFYGIWCSASKDQKDAENVADKLSSRGFYGQVFVTSDWEKLNSEKWYVVTAGVYPDKEDAEAALSEVKSAGYPDAYIKYTGNYTGE